MKTLRGHSFDVVAWHTQPYDVDKGRELLECASPDHLKYRRKIIGWVEAVHGDDGRAKQFPVATNPMNSDYVVLNRSGGAIVQCKALRSYDRRGRPAVVVNPLVKSVVFERADIREIETREPNCNSSAVIRAAVRYYLDHVLTGQPGDSEGAVEEDPLSEFSDLL